MELLQVQVPRARFLEALRSFLGRAWGDVTDDDHATCVGVILLALIEVGLLPPDFDANLSDIPPSRRMAWLMGLLRQNAREFDPRFPWMESGEVQSGDLLLSCWADADVTRTVVHHVAIYTDAEPTPYGTQLQSLSREHGGAGTVYEAPMSSLDWHRVELVWRLHALTDESGTDGEG